MHNIRGIPWHWHSLRRTTAVAIFTHRGCLCLRHHRPDRWTLDEYRRIVFRITNTFEQHYWHTMRNVYSVYCFRNFTVRSKLINQSTDYKLYTYTHMVQIRRYSITIGSITLTEFAGEITIQNVCDSFIFEIERRKTKKKSNICECTNRILTVVICHPWDK